MPDKQVAEVCPMIRDEADFAAAAASSVALIGDVFGQTAAPDYWNWSEDTHRAVLGSLMGLGDLPLKEAATQLLGDPGSGALHHALQDRIRELLTRDEAPGLEELAAAVWSAERVSRLRFHVGAEWRVHEGRTSLADLAERRRGGPPSTGAVAAAVVIPFRARATQPERLRNLLAVLNSLNQQTFDRQDYSVVVVEADDEPRWRELIEPLCDRYVFAPHSGRFNKAWATNVGVTRGAPEADVVCLLDADILVDAHFVQHAVERFQEAGTQAHWPFLDMLFLDARSSELAIRDRCVRGRPAVDHATLRGVYLRRPPGGCIWLRTSLFRRVGGMDERFEGWGGEDQDFEWRVDRYGILDRHADPLVHLDHPRAAYRADDGTPFYKEISFCSWPCDSEIGNLRKYATEA